MRAVATNLTKAMLHFELLINEKYTAAKKRYQRTPEKRNRALSNVEIEKEKQVTLKIQIPLNWRRAVA
jgi:hypothetical protein